MTRVYRLCDVERDDRGYSPAPRRDVGDGASHGGVVEDVGESLPRFADSGFPAVRHSSTVHPCTLVYTGDTFFS